MVRVVGVHFPPMLLWWWQCEAPEGWEASIAPMLWPDALAGWRLRRARSSAGVTVAVELEGEDRASVLEAARSLDGADW